MAEVLTYDRNIFADNLKRLMKARHEKQVDIARLLGVSKSTVSSYCSASQMPRMDKIETLAHHFGVSRSQLIGDEPAAPAPAPELPEEEPLPTPQILLIYDALNERGQAELTRYGRYLTKQKEYQAPEPPQILETIRHFLVPAAAGYASPIQGEDYEEIPRTPDTPAGADFCITIQGDSMEPFIPDGSLVYVKRGAPMKEFEVGVFFVDGDVFCKQWCTDYAGTLHLLSANPLREDANISIPRDSGRSCICFGKVLLGRKLPQPEYD
ncbi:MAG: helix-turn-helix domain-containing protein [Oscillospiraceae bacterium]|nr:helix-turn-helix domain-containing protein [Oscillospiraceae bacterium]